MGMLAQPPGAKHITPSKSAQRPSAGSPGWRSIGPSTTPSRPNSLRVFTPCTSTPPDSLRPAGSGPPLASKRKAAPLLARPLSTQGHSKKRARLPWPCSTRTPIGKIGVSPDFHAASRKTSRLKDQLEAGRDTDRVDHVAGVQPPQDFGDMTLHGLFMPSQRLRDLFVGEPLGAHRQHFHLCL